LNGQKKQKQEHIQRSSKH